MSKGRHMQQHSSSLEEFGVRRAEPFHLATFLYNAEKGTVMNRDSLSWCKFKNNYISKLISNYQKILESLLIENGV